MQKMFDMIREGRNSDYLLSKIERDLLLSDFKARGVTKSWGSLIKSDHYIYDNIDCKFTVKADEKEKQLAIFKNTDDIIVKVTDKEGKTKQIDGATKMKIDPNTEALVEVKQIV